MATLREMENRVLDAKNSVEMIMMRILDEYKTRILDLNREDQIFQGETTSGDIIGNYSWATENIYGGRYHQFPKIEHEPYNLKDTGAMFASFNLEFNDGYLRIFSTDWKGKMWEDKIKESSTGTLHGLNEENEMILNYDFIRPELLEDLKRILYNK